MEADALQMFPNLQVRHLYLYDSSILDDKKRTTLKSERADVSSALTMSNYIKW
jgi:hypothetical protein